MQVTPERTAAQAPSVLRSGLHTHWNETIRGLDLRGILLAGLGVFLTYFQLNRSALPAFLTINAYLTILAFLVVVCRFHMFQSIEPDMSAWWDVTIPYASRRIKAADFALEGPWLFFLMAMPFSTISMVSFGVAYLSWSTLECFFLRAGRLALRETPRHRVLPGVRAEVDRYYDVRFQHEAAAALLAALVLVTILLARHSHVWLWLNGAALGLLILLLTVVEVTRNPWFTRDLGVRLEADILSPETGQT